MMLHCFLVVYILMTVVLKKNFVFFSSEEGGYVTKRNKFVFHMLIFQFIR